MSYVIYLQFSYESTLVSGSRVRMTWDLGFILPMILYLCVMMPFRLCFDNEPEVFTAIYWFEFVIDMVRKTNFSFELLNVRVSLFKNKLFLVLT
jgi:hypothetical protein